MIPLSRADIVKETNKLLSDGVLIIKGEFLDGVEDDGIGKNGGVK